MMKRLVIFFLMIFSLESYSDDIWIHTGMLSKHLTGSGYNEDHELLGIEYNDWYVGYYPNSFNDDSFFIFKNYRNWQLSENISLGGRVGIISGYDFGVDVAGTDIVPVVVPTLFIDCDPISVDFHLLGTIYSIELKWKL